MFHAQNSNKHIDESLMKGDSLSGNQLVSEDGSSLYLIPTPTTNLADPLNWHPVRKWAVLGLLLLWSSAALSIQSFLLNYLPSVAERFPEANANQINLLGTIIMVMIAPGQLFFTPLAIAYGRRFSLLLANTLLLVSSVWGALATSYNSLLAARIVEGFAAGPTDCMVYVMVQEFTFIHERGTIMGALMAGQLALQLCIGIGTNYMAITTSFKAPFYMFAAISAFTLVGMFLFMPETRFDREENELLPRVKVTDFPEFRRNLGAHNAGEGQDSTTFTLAKQLKPWATKERGRKDHSVVHFFKRMTVYLLSPTMWWNAGLNTIMCG